MAEYRLTVQRFIIVTVASIQRVFAKGSQNLDHMVDTVDQPDAFGSIGKGCGLLTTCQFHGKHHVQYLLIEAVCKDHLRHFLTDRIGAVSVVYWFDRILSK